MGAISLHVTTVVLTFIAMLVAAFILTGFMAGSSCWDRMAPNLLHVLIMAVPYVVVVLMIAFSALGATRPQIGCLVVVAAWLCSCWAGLPLQAFAVFTLAVFALSFLSKVLDYIKSRIWTSSPPTA